MTMFQGNELSNIRSDIEALLLPETVKVLAASHGSGLYPEETFTVRETTVGRLDRLARADSQGMIAELEAGKTYYQLTLKYDSTVQDGDNVYIDGVVYTCIQVSRDQTNKFVRRVIVAENRNLDDYYETSGQVYADNVATLSPTAFWRGNESSGTTLTDNTTPQYNGVHTGVSLTAAASPFGDYAPLYDGSTSYSTMYSPELASAFDGTKGYISFWYKVRAASVLTDGTTRYLLYWEADASNLMFFARIGTDNLFRFRHMAGGTPISTTHTITSTDDVHIYIEFSDGANDDYLRVYINGVLDANVTGLGTWTGSFVSPMNIGGQGSPSSVWDGYLSNVVIKANAAANADERTILSDG